MKLFFSILLLTVISISNSQTENYNTKNGLALKGYDVVSYFKNMPKKGNSKIIYNYDGVTYQFTSQEHLNMFKSNPEKYLPKYGGYCAYAIAKKGKKVNVDPETYEIRDGKLYLFYNAWGNNTLKNWLNNSPEELVKKANINWKNLN